MTQQPNSGKNKLSEARITGGGEFEHSTSSRAEKMRKNVRKALEADCHCLLVLPEDDIDRVAKKFTPPSLVHDSVPDGVESAIMSPLSR